MAIGLALGYEVQFNHGFREGIEANLADIEGASFAWNAVPVVRADGSASLAVAHTVVGRDLASVPGVKEIEEEGELNAETLQRVSALDVLLDAAAKLTESKTGHGNEFPFSPYFAHGVTSKKTLEVYANIGAVSGKRAELLIEQFKKLCGAGGMAARAALKLGPDAREPSHKVKFGEVQGYQDARFRASARLQRGFRAVVEASAYPDLRIGDGVVVIKPYGSD